MPDIQALPPYRASPDLVAYRDASEVDLWARAPFYVSPDLILYPRGPVREPIEEAGVGAVEVSTTPAELTWLTVAPSLTGAASTAAAAVSWLAVAPSLAGSIGGAPDAVAWLTVAPTAETSGGGLPVFFTWCEDE